eukprot:TRINITY_DN4703_c0_g1_i1.p1 TRINITY_DN4703_c0_g1~~TRINITY_DN4703_c0_g1_i1.p1  ORF type:complete len:622 (-),score=129.97 TRINITY_DN4703_c0_g1_i1:150-2015(-)
MVIKQPSSLAVFSSGIALLIFAVLSFAFEGIAIFLYKKYEREDNAIMLKGSRDKDGASKESGTNSSLLSKVIILGRFAIAFRILSAFVLYICMLAASSYDFWNVAGTIVLSFPVLFFGWELFMPWSTEEDGKLWGSGKNSVGVPTYGRAMWRRFKGIPKRAVSHPVLFWIPLILILFISIVIPILLAGTCQDDLRVIDTRITRMGKASTCKAGPPCHVYITMPFDPAHAMIVNYHTTPPDTTPGALPKSSVVYYDTVSHAGEPPSAYRFVAHGDSYRMPHLEVDRDVHWVHLTSLDPATTYYFIAGPGDNTPGAKYSAELSFQTLAEDGSPYTFVVGGDIDTTDTSVAISKIAAKQSPTFAMVGGDLAYDRAQYTCYRIVDKWLNNWYTSMVTPTGHLIPLVSAIGNHEVMGDYGAKHPDEMPYYGRYFPQMDASEDPGADGVDQRLTYHAHLIGNSTLILSLDSGHYSTVDGVQTEWLKQTLETYKDVPIKFALYHVPMYPTIRSYDSIHSAKVRENWQPLFDEYHVTIGFENHDHVYKRTKLIKGGEESAAGTLYLGDGSWGVSTRSVSHSRWYQNKAQGANYILRADVNPTAGNVDLTAFDPMGATFDTFSAQVTPSS